MRSKRLKHPKINKKKYAKSIAVLKFCVSLQSILMMEQRVNLLKQRTKSK